MKVAFITEMGFTGKINANHPNMRTEFAWMHALDADHFPIYLWNNIKHYDHIFIIFPKGQINYSVLGTKLSNTNNPYSELLSSNWLDILKENNNKIYYVQEGPHWMYNELELVDQIHFYNMLNSVDMIFVHNKSNISYYAGLTTKVPIAIMPTLMIEDLIKDLKWNPEEKAIIGGNFSRWYGGFESYIIAQNLDVPIYGQTSHAIKEGEDQLITHLPRVQWIDWMKQLSTFKYAIHLMPTVAAGTFYLNCAYLGIPCIGNEEVDTQLICYKDLSVNINDLDRAKILAKELKLDKSFYKYCSDLAKERYKSFQLNVWKIKIIDILKYNEEK